MSVLSNLGGSSFSSCWDWKSDPKGFILLRALGYFSQLIWLFLVDSAEMFIFLGASLNSALLPRPILFLLERPRFLFLSLSATAFEFWLLVVDTFDRSNTFLSFITLLLYLVCLLVSLSTFWLCFLELALLSWAGFLLILLIEQFWAELLVYWFWSSSMI